MLKQFRSLALAAAVALFSASPAGARDAGEQQSRIDFVQLDEEITLRRLVVRNPDAKQAVLLLHGFPETIYAWQSVAERLGGEFEVHAFDWPGYGLSSRPDPGRFAYAPSDYARVLKQYLEKTGLDPAALTIYATDIGALPALLLALDHPRVAKRIIVGDFAPFDRPHYMYASLQSLKSPSTAEQVRVHLNRSRDEIIENSFFRGLPDDARYAIEPAFKEDMQRGWNNGRISSADAFAHYYAGFGRDQDRLEAEITRVKTPVTVLWGEKDLYISSAMGSELAERTGAGFSLLQGIGHYPHLQAPELVADAIRAAR